MTVRRVEEHRAGKVDGHSRRHGITRLVWFEQHQYVDQAILREKRIKRWQRPWKFRLIEESNPRWTVRGAGGGSLAGDAGR